MSAASPAAEPDNAIVGSGKQSSGLGQIVLTSVITGVLTASLGLFAQDKASDWAEKRQLKTKDVTEFVTAAQKFDDLVGDYVVKLKSGGATSKERSDLQANLQLQSSTLETAKTYLAEPQADRATDYQSELAELSDKLSAELPLLESGTVVQSIADTRAKNVCVVYDLRSVAGLPVIKSDAARCENFKRP